MFVPNVWSAVQVFGLPVFSDAMASPEVGAIVRLPSRLEIVLTNTDTGTPSAPMKLPKHLS